MASKTISTILNLKDNFSSTIKNTTANTNAFTKQVASSKSIISSFANGASSSFKNIAGSILGIAGTYVGVKAVFNYVKDGVEMAKASETGLAQLGAVLTSTNDACGMSKDAILELAGSYGSYTTYGKGAVLAGENLLLTFTGLGKDILPDVTTTMLDMSTALGQDVTASAMTLGKALNDPATGLTKLTKQGVTFTEEQKNQVAAMVKSGNTLGAQKIMLQELQKEFGGSAKAIGDTLPGKIIIMQNAFKGIQKSIGEKFIPVLFNIYSFAVAQMPNIKAIFTSVFNEVGNVVTTVMDIFTNEVLPVLTDLWTTAQPTLANLKDGFIESFGKIKTIAGDVFNNIKTFVDNNKGAFLDCIESIFKLGKTIYDDLEPKIMNLVKTVLPALQGAFEGNKGIINDVLKIATDAFNFINDHWGTIKPLVEGITLAVAGWKLGLFLTELQIKAVALTSKAFEGVKIAIQAIQGWTDLWALAQWGVNGAMDANIIGVVILGIELLGFAIYEVIQHWQDICTWISTTWDKLKNNPVAEFIVNMNPFTGLLYEIAKHWTDITDAISKAWDWLTKWNGTKMEDKKANAYTTQENSQNTNTENAFNTNSAGNVPSSNDTDDNTSYKATGTHYWKGGSVIVGEHGRELVNLPAGSKVSTASETQKAMGGNGGGDVHIYFNGNVGTEEFFNQAGEFIAQKIRTGLLNQ